MELHKDPEGKMQNSASQKQEDRLRDYLMLPMCVLRIWKSCFVKRQRQHAHMEDRREALTRQDTCQVNHPHFESFVDQFQRDSQYQLHYQVAHDVLHTVGVDKAEYTQPHSSSMQDVGSRWFTIVWRRKMF